MTYKDKDQFGGLLQIIYERERNLQGVPKVEKITKQTQININKNKPEPTKVQSKSKKKKPTPRGQPAPEQTGTTRKHQANHSIPPHRMRERTVKH